MLKTLQAGRALAAISVAAFHLSIGMGVDRYGANPVFQQYTKHGNLGVDFFFVLSGFIILFAHIGDIGRPKMWGAYVYKRFVRVFPIYWLYSLVFVLLMLLGLGANAEMPSDLATWISSITLIRFSSGIPTLAVAWTLFHEMAFYAAFSLLILNRRVGTAFFLLAIVIIVFYFQYPDRLNRTAFNVYTSAYGLSFICGMASYWLFQRGGRGVVELIAGILILLAASLSMPLPADLSQLVFAIGFAAVLAGATKLEAGAYIKVPRFLILIGDASYTIYLIHLLLEGAILKLVFKLHLYQTLGPYLAYLLTLVGTIACGCVVYLVVERPLLAALRRPRGKPVPVPTV